MKTSLFGAKANFPIHGPKLIINIYILIILEMKLRPHQQRAIKAIAKAFEEYDKCLVKMFCGTGKTRIVFHEMMTLDLNLSVMVFPSISLVSQFVADYLLNERWEKLTKKHSFMSICSRNEVPHANVKCTTAPTVIKRFLKKPGKKVVSVTYQSLGTFVEAIKDTGIKIDLIVYDEAHHIVGSSVQNIVFGRQNRDIDYQYFEDIWQKAIFLTATPKNANGVCMLEMEVQQVDLEDVDSEETTERVYRTDCGTLAFEYTHREAVQDGVCNNFKIAIDFSADKDYPHQNVYSAISRCIFSTNNKKCLTFHFRSETAHESRSHVIDFVNKKNVKNFEKEYETVLKKEFPKKKNYSGLLVVDGITGNTRNKQEILTDFDEDTENVRVLASCNTIGEGIDTKNANIACFVDPRTSYHTIIQNIGRVTRKQAKISTILLPCYVDKEKYMECETAEERDEVIRQEMNEDGNFNMILNTLSALRQDDPEFYDLCINYPNRYAPREVRDNLWRHGLKVDDAGDTDIKTCLNHTAKSKELSKYKGDDINKMGEIINKRIVVHSTDMKDPITVYNDDEDLDEIVLYHNKDTDEYRPTTPIKKVKRTKKITRPKRRQTKINVHTNPDVKVLWDIVDDIDMTKTVCQAYIESTVVENNWSERLEELEGFIDEYGRLPSGKSKDPEEKRIAKWLSNQQQNYKNNKGGMLDLRRRKLWEEHKEKYLELYITYEEKWCDNLEKLEEFIDEYGNLPSKKSKDPVEKRLGQWRSDQTQNYKNSKEGMSDPRRRKLWEEHKDRYSELYMTDDENWHDNLGKLEEFIDEYENLPSQKSKDPEERFLGNWRSSQIHNYKNNNKGMSDPERRRLWEEHKEKYPDLYMSNEEKWYFNLRKLREFIMDYGKSPLQCSKDPEEKRLGNWRYNQTRNYKQCRGCLKDPTKRKAFAKLLLSYPEHFPDTSFIDDCDLPKVKK